ncbi:MAG: alpha-L-arabinofuranosidase C-terminal domain-containing protein [Planctomycetota bacterium]
MTLVLATWVLIPLLPLPTAAAAEDPHPRAPSVKVTVTAKELAERPTSPLICGNFIECGFGRQVEGMWAEMFFNRGFESIPPYSDALYESRGYGPEVELEKQPWWHSGYEESPWELAPGNAKARWSYEEHLSFWNGQRGGWLVNESEDAWAGVAQRGLHLRKGERYLFSGMLRTGAHPWDMAPANLSTDAEIRIYPDGDWVQPIVTHTLRGIGKAFERRDWTFDNSDYSGRATFSLFIPPQAILGVDVFSLMPASNLSGWRSDVVAASRRVNPRIIRWPGGCFASFYRWRDGIGERSERRPAESWFWGGLYDNDVGTCEFIEFCRLVGAEPFICVNMLSGDAEEAADWVAYCNAPASHPVGKLRERDGFTEPFHVHFWELDNETNRRFGPAQYAQRCVDFARAMKAVDPSIEIAIVGYDWFRLALTEILEIAGPHIDYVVDRAIDEGTLRADLDLLVAYNRQHGTHLRLCNTEWPAPEYDVPAAIDRDELEKIVTVKGRQRCWYSAMNVAKTLLTFQRLGGDFAFANFNNFANTWGQNVIECAKESVYLAPAGHVFELFSRSPAAWPLALEVSGSSDRLIIQAAWDEGRTALCLVLLNYDSRETLVRVSFERLGKGFSSAATTTLKARSLTAYGTPKEPHVVQRTDEQHPLADAASCEIMAVPFSLTQVILR